MSKVILEQKTNYLMSYLISASSSFAQAAQLLGGHLVLMFPVWAVTMPDKIVINKVGVIRVKGSRDIDQRKMEYHEITVQMG